MEPFDIKALKGRIIRGSAFAFGLPMGVVVAPTAVFGLIHGPLLLQLVVFAAALCIVVWVSLQFGKAIWRYVRGQVIAAAGMAPRSDVAGEQSSPESRS